MKYQFLTLLYCSILLLSVGCEQSTSVEGTVTLNGEPIKKGSISLRSVDGTGPSIGAMIVDGHYSIPEAAPGTRVAVITAVREGQAIQSRAEGIRLAEQARAEGRRPNKASRGNLIPPDAEGNNRAVEIKQGSQTLDFAIKTK